MTSRVTTCARIRVSSRAKSGFTLVETMLALMILVMMTGIVAMGVPMAFNSYSKVVDGSNAQVLLTTTTSVLRDELSEAQVNDPSDYPRSGVDGSLTTYKTGFGWWASIKLGYCRVDDKDGALDDDMKRKWVDEKTYNSTRNPSDSNEKWVQGLIKCTYVGADAPSPSSEPFDTQGLIPSSAITESLGVLCERIEYSPSNGTFTITGLKVIDRQGNTVADVGVDDSFLVRTIS